MEVSTHPVVGLALRPATPDDIPFLETVYASTREGELAQTDWGAEQKASFLKMQFDLQHQYYHAHYPDAAFDIICHAGQAIGRHYLWRGQAVLNLIDIALLPAWRGRGYGSALMQRLLAEARTAGKAIQLHVEHDNPANRLYARLGFVPSGSNGVYLKLRWQQDVSVPLAEAS